MKKNPVIPTQENIRRWMLKFAPKYINIDSQDYSILYDKISNFFNINLYNQIIFNQNDIAYINNSISRFVNRQEDNSYNVINFYIGIYKFIFKTNITEREKLKYWKYYMSNEEILNKFLLIVLSKIYNQREIGKIYIRWNSFWIRESNIFNIIKRISAIDRLQILRDNYEKISI